MLFADETSIFFAFETDTLKNHSNNLKEIYK